MKSTFRNIAPLMLVAILVVSLSGFASASDRTAKQKTTPTYPELAKHMNISGTVKVEVTVAPNGHVLSAKAIGGHPLLIDASVQAAKQFKYEPSGEETKEIVEFKFNNGQN